MLDEAKVMVKGHVLIKDTHTGEVILDKDNAIHFENMSLAIAQSLASQTNLGPVWEMVFGNGGASLSGVGTVTYLTPNIIGANATLYNQTYQKIVNGLDPNNSEPLTNNIVVSHVNGNVFSDIIVSCTLDVGEPSGQNAIDNTATMSAPFVFNELGLIDYAGKLLTHVIFSPVEKSTNRSFSITYTVRFQLI